MARARGEEHRFDGQAEKVDASEELLDDVSADSPIAVPLAADNARQAQRAARARARRRGPAQ